MRSTLSRRAVQNSVILNAYHTNRYNIVRDKCIVPFRIMFHQAGIKKSMNIFDPLYSGTRNGNFNSRSENVQILV